MYAIPYVLLTYMHQAAINARRRDRTWRYLGWSAVAGAFAGIMFSIGIVFAWGLVLAGLWWMAIIMVALLAVPPAANVLVRHVIAPLGWVRAAYFLGLFSRPGKDAQAYALCCAAWALASKHSGAGEVWLAAKRDARVPLGDAEVVVTALVATGRGDAETTRVLLRSTAHLVEYHPAVRELAGEWLAVDAAARGAWAELVADATAARWPASPLAFFLEGVAARRTNAAGAPSDRELWGRWLLAPHRRHTRALLAIPEALPSAQAVPEPTDDRDSPPDRAPLPRAVAAHLAFGRGLAPTTVALAFTVRAWDAALVDATTRTWLARRAHELDAPLGSVERCVREVAAAVTAELGRIADTASLGAPMSHGLVGSALTQRLRHGRLDALDQGFTRWEQRRHDGASRAPIDEWREWIALRVAYDAAVTAGGLELRRLAFPNAYGKGQSMAAWLWNQRKEYVLSHAISKWLLDEALVVGDTEAIELGHKNCSLDVPTRLAKR